MYTLNPNAIGVKKGLNKRWEEVDLSTPTVKSLFETYRILQITLTPQDASEPVFLMLHELNAEFQDYADTVQAMLDAYYATDALPTHTTALIRDHAVARFYDAFKLRYGITLVDANNDEPPVIADIEDYDHLRIERQDTRIDSVAATTQVLVNVNGYYHRAENVNNRGIFVRDAMKSLRKSGQNQIGLWDFKDLGGVTVVPTVPGYVVAEGSAFQVDLTQDVSEKTVFFVVGGYFLPVDGTVVAQNGVKNFLIDFTHLSFRAEQRYFESANYLDMSAVAEAAASVTPGLIDLDKLTQADSVAAWMAMKQSFVVIINRKDCYMQMRYLKRTLNPNQYICYLDRDLSNLPNEIEDPRLSLQPPDLPMVLELGRHPPYWTTTEGWMHTLSIYSNRIGQILYDANAVPGQVQTSGPDQPGAPLRPQHAFLLEFGSDVQDA